jgi:PAS domain S-box-containing protein
METGVSRQFESSDSTPAPRTRFARRLENGASVLGVIVAVIGACYLVAWLSGHMADSGLSSVTVKTNTALCLLLSGLALVLVRPEHASPWRIRTGRMMAVSLVVLGILTICENLTGWNLRIDEILATEPPGAVGVTSPNRMGMPASISFTLTGLALVILSRRYSARIRTAQGLALCVCLIALPGIIGYLYSVENLYSVARLTGVAMPTAVALLMLGIGLLLARSGQGLMVQVTATDPGAAGLRRWLPVLLLPVLLGWLHLMSERTGAFDNAAGTALVIIGFMAALAVLAYTGSLGISRTSLAVRESELRYRSFVQASAQVVWTTDAHGQVNLEIPSWQSFTGQSAEQARGFGWMEAIDPADRDRVAAAWAKAFESSGIYEVEYRLRVRDGSWRDILARGVPIFGVDGRIREYVGTCIDITDRKQAEKRLRDSEDRLHFALETSHTGAWDLDLADHSAFRSLEHDRIFGYTELLPCWTYEMFLDHVIPEDRAAVDDKFRQATTNRGDWNFECRIRRQDGEVRWIWAAGRHRTDVAGNARRIAGIVQDITERKHAEEVLRRTVDELERSNRELEQFAYVSAHDLQEPLRQVKAYVALLKDRHADRFEGKAKQYFDFVYEGAARMSALVSGLLAYSRVRMGERNRQQVCCRESLEAALANLRSSIERSGARISHDELPTVNADPTQLTQLFQNLIGNALKYRRDGLSPEVHIGCRRQGDAMVVFVRDNGIGIAPRYHAQVFELFKRLHARDKYPGTGIGLAICKRIVEQHGGKIWIESEVGSGATVCFTFSENV